MKDLFFPHINMNTKRKSKNERDFLIQSKKKKKKRNVGFTSIYPNVVFIGDLGWRGFKRGVARAKKVLGEDQGKKKFRNFSAFSQNLFHILTFLFSSSEFYDGGVFKRYFSLSYKYFLCLNLYNKSTLVFFIYLCWDICNC